MERINEQSITLKIEADQKLHGKIIAPDGFYFAYGSAERVLEGGNFNLSRIKE